jgi:sugar O-acyltransferase (sialic acid O-acetyltransferase NeuD family)
VEPVRPLVLFGTGELARLVHAFLAAEGRAPVACTVDREYAASARLADLPVVPWEELPERYPPSEVAVLVAVGYRRVNRARAETVARVREAGYRLASYVHPSAIVAPDVEIRPNTIVFERVVVQPFVTLGADVVVWCSATIAHDSVVGDHCFLAPEAAVSGNVTIGAYSFVGLNATVRDGVTVGEGCVIGAGAVVKHDTAPGDVYPAVPTPAGSRSAADYDNL